MKLKELFEAKSKDEFRTREDWTKNKFITDRSEYERERSEKLGKFGTISTTYKEAVEEYLKGNNKKLDNLIVSSIIASIGYDRALIDRSANLEDSLRRDLKVGVVRGKNFGTYQEQKTLEGFIKNGGNLNQIYVSTWDEKDDKGRPTGKKIPVDARRYWTSPYRSGVITPMLQAKMWAHTEHDRIEEVNNFLNSNPINVSVERISEIINILKTIEKFETENKEKFQPIKTKSRSVKIQSNIDKNRIKNKEMVDKNKEMVDKNKSSEEQKELEKEIP